MDSPGNLWMTLWRELRIRRLGVRVPPSARSERAPSALHRSRATAFSACGLFRIAAVESDYVFTRPAVVRTTRSRFPGSWRTSRCWQAFPA